MNITIRAEIIDDQQAIWKLNQVAFGGVDEANLVDALRHGGFIAMSLVAELYGEIVGHILFSRVTIITKVAAMNAVSLAPMAVLPRNQRQGIGSNLVKAGLKACRERGHRIAIVLGHPEFYFQCPHGNELRATVNPNNNLAHCFSCGRNINNLDLMLLQGHDFLPAVTIATATSVPKRLSCDRSTTTVAFFKR